LSWKSMLKSNIGNQNTQNWVVKHVWGVEGNGKSYVVRRKRSKHWIGNCETHSKCSSPKSKFPSGKGKEAMEKTISCTR
jgi:hypothetical protein